MPSLNNAVHVAVAVIKNIDGQYLIAKRPQLAHQGGLWEFPGGKVEKSESVFQALQRELFEEVGISITKATPLIRIPHHYSDKSVLLDVWLVENFTGEAFAKEEQEVRWVAKDDFSLYDFPLANKSIINAISLPDKYMISGKFNNEEELLNYVQAGLDRGIQLIQFRALDIDENLYFEYAEKLYFLCEKNNAQLLLNTSIEKYKKHNAEQYSHGIHLTSHEIKKFSKENFNSDLLFSTSIHNQDELMLAQEKNIKFCVLSPVNKTASHPDTQPLGWRKFRELTELATIPLYALGGMLEEDLMLAKENGAQGISAIGEFWYL